MKTPNWQLIERRVILQHPRFLIQTDELHLPNGEQATFTYLVKPPSVFVLALTENNELVLLRQYRHIVGRWLWEIPAGGSLDFEGEDWAELARRELWEEAGGRAEQMDYLGEIVALSGLLRQTIYVYLATGVHLDATNHTERTETIEVHPLPLDEAIARIREEADALDGYVVLKYEPRLRAAIAQALQLSRRDL